MYPSDYGYATSGGTSMNRTSCLAKELYNWDGASDCYNNDWLLDSSNTQWTISPRAHSVTAISVFNVNSGGTINNSHAKFAQSVRPSVYLKSNVSILSGEGTPENPYTIG